jgi:hypothetical protein
MRVMKFISLVAVLIVILIPALARGAGRGAHGQTRAHRQRTGELGY